MTEYQKLFFAAFECGHQYLCSIYLVMSIVSSTAFPKRRVPRSLGGMAITTCAAITAVFSLVVLLGDITALVRNSVYNLSKYDFEVKEFLVSALLYKLLTF